MLKGKLTKIELERWATMSWAIWNARNKYYFEKVQMQPRSVMDHAMGTLEDYQRLAASQNTIAVYHKNLGCLSLKGSFNMVVETRGVQQQSIPDPPGRLVRFGLRTD